MALANKCDRCGKLYEYYPLGNEPGVCNAIKRVRVNNKGWVIQENNHLDLCPECMNSLNAFLRNTEKVEVKKERICSAYHEETGSSNPLSRLGRCWGTKEMDICSCGGDTNKCDFYPEKRKEKSNA